MLLLWLISKLTIMSNQRYQEGHHCSSWGSVVKNNGGLSVGEPPQRTMEDMAWGDCSEGQWEYKGGPGVEEEGGGALI